MGAEAYELLVNLCTPDKPSEKTFADLTAILARHLQPKPSVLAERYKFRQRKQRSGENIAEYVAILKKMSKFCEFGSWLEESIRDQFVCGISSETIRQRLFAEDKLDYGKAFNLAVSMESAEKDAALVESQGELAGTGGSKVECHAVMNSRRTGGKPTPKGNQHSGSSEQRRQSGQRAASGAGGGAAAATAGAQARCSGCGGAHQKASCKFSKYVCRVCNKQGHLQRVCPYMVQHHDVTAENPYNDGSENEGSDEVFNLTFLNTLSISECAPKNVMLNVQGRNVSMEYDTGSAVSCISDVIYNNMFADLELRPCNLSVWYYTGERVKPMGVIRPLVRYKGKEKVLDLYVLKNGKSGLMGRQWMAELNVTPPEIIYVNSLEAEEFNIFNFSSRYCKVFEDGLGRFTGGRVSIHLREGARPVFLRARPLAYALREPVERALDQLVRDDILTPVDRSDWATPIVPVVKKDGTIRICADYKLTLNKVLEVDRYPLPRVEDLLARLYGGERYSKIDLSQAYAQFELDGSKKYSVINTHKGLYMYNRLIYGLASSPGIFQRKLETLFADMPHVGVFLDDVIITGCTAAEHIKNLHNVFKRLEAYGLKVKKEKCSFFAESINYLGYVISRKGVHTCTDKVQAIVDTPAPSNVSELRSFIGMVMYYAKFVKNVSTILAPLYDLLKVGVNFVWSDRCREAFDRIKKALSSSEVLTHYSAELPLVLTADASGVGVGAVISHVTPDGERPVAYASRSLTAAERDYAQIDREALAIIFGVRKFHQYLYGRKFLLRTDHKPLTFIFGDKIGIPVMAASRVQRWAVLLAGYTYDIEYVPSKKNCADALSRLPLPTKKEGRVKEKTYVNFVEDFMPVTNNDVRSVTSRDAELSRVMLYIQAGWPPACPDTNLNPYFARRNELYVDGGCIMWGYRMVVPSVLRHTVLKQLHCGHMGIVKTKSTARSYVWWPNIDVDIEQLCKQCETCGAEAAAPPRAPPQPWSYSTQPWSRIHIDFLGPLESKTYLVLVDSSTKWIECIQMKRTTAEQVIKVLRAIFARFGLPGEVVSDQGPPFASAEFSSFLKKNGIRQTWSPAYHPASNGAAENAVKICKNAIKKAYRDNVDVDAALQSFLLAYRNSIQNTTGETPAMLLQKRNLRSRIDLIRKGREVENKVHNAQQKQVQDAGRGVLRELLEGDPVWARGYGSEKWVKGTVTKRNGSREYVIDRGNGRLTRKHIDQIRRRPRMSDVTCPDSTHENEEDRQGLSRGEENNNSPPMPESDAASPLRVNEALSTNKKDTLIIPSPSPSGNELFNESKPPPPSTPVERPKRNRRPVKRFEIDT